MRRLAAERVTLRSGAEIDIRPIDPSDASRLVEALQALSPESRYRRFLAPKTRLSRKELAYLTDVDHHDHEALVAMRPDGDEGVAVARFIRDPSECGAAEAAIVVADDWQNRGVGHALLRRLAERAIDEGVHTFTATVLASNDSIISLLGDIGPVASKGASSGAVELRIELPPGAGCPAAASATLRAAARGDLELTLPDTG